MAQSDIRYRTTRDGAEIAYQRSERGAVDIVWLPHLLFGLDHYRDFGPIAGWLSGLESIGRLLVRDPRGTGMSDRANEPADLATDVADLVEILDAEDIERVAVIGNLRGAAVGAYMAAFHPDRVSSLILWNPIASALKHPDYPWGQTPEEMRADLEGIVAAWGQGRTGMDLAGAEGPSGRVDVDFHEWMARMMRGAVTPGRARVLLERMNETDVRAILPTIRVRTLVLAKSGASPDEAQWIASNIPGSEIHVLPGDDTMPWFGDLGGVLDEIRLFIGVASAPPTQTRFLSTLLFTDIADSTARAASIGDDRWRRLIEEHHRLTRGLVAHFHGREVDTAGDGFFAAFDSPTDAVQCGLAVIEAMQILDLHVRAGVHTGECQLVDGKVAGLAVSIGSRVGSLASPGQLLASSTVKDLTAGAGLVFEDAGEHALKGVPDTWRLYRVRGDATAANGEADATGETER